MNMKYVTALFNVEFYHQAKVINMVDNLLPFV